VGHLQGVPQLFALIPTGVGRCLIMIGYTFILISVLTDVYQPVTGPTSFVAVTPQPSFVW